MRGSLEGDVPVDSTIYRIHEVTQVDGVTIKALINKKFSAGIMSAITLNLGIKRVESKVPSQDHLRRQVPPILLGLKSPKLHARSLARETEGCHIGSCRIE